VAARLAERWRRGGATGGFTLGAFDPLSPGHVHLIEQAHGACDRLIVAVQGDAAVRRAKGGARPHQPEAVRAARLASLPSVDLVLVDHGASEEELLRAFRPGIVLQDAEMGDAAAVVAEWGGRVLPGETLPDTLAD
jgi:D-beta-D-heptose 7-phosphate kinase/D-beta-D-heptose 1-phosphate adenosyltransferase